MKRQEREELERLVQRIEREHPEWPAAAVEAEVGRLAPVAYGSWRDETPARRSRLRSVQRWRRGSRGRDSGKGVRQLFPYVWPVGDRQRRELDPAHDLPHLVVSGSWRLYLYNCGPEVVRDVRVAIDQIEVDYAPAILTGRFNEVHWQRLDALRLGLLSAGAAPSRHALSVEFVVERGTRQARLAGHVVLDPAQGWIGFESRDGRRREIE